jgi:hypothetical protein
LKNICPKNQNKNLTDTLSEGLHREEYYSRGLQNVSNLMGINGE